MTSLPVQSPGVRHLVVGRLVALRRTVADLERSIAFYCDGLGFRVVDTATDSGLTTLAIGAERIELIAATDPDFRAPQVPGRDVRFQHAAIVARDIDAALSRLKTHLTMAPISRDGVQQLPPASGGVRAFKFRDSEGHPLELIEFPEGTGAARWRAGAGADHSEGLTLGIDHVAISVSQVEHSIDFYRRIGFKLTSRQVNLGVEQARLDGIDDPRAKVEVDVIALEPAAQHSPHLELLGYGAPPACRGSGTDDGADQLVWQVPAPGNGPDRLLRDPDDHIHRMHP